MNKLMKVSFTLALASILGFGLLTMTSGPAQAAFEPPCPVAYCQSIPGNVPVCQPTTQGLCLWGQCNLYDPANPTHWLKRCTEYQYRFGSRVSRCYTGCIEA